MSNSLRKFVRNNTILYGTISCYRYLRYRRVYDRLPKNVHVLDPVQSVTALAESDKSLSRFGDSELRLLYKQYSIGFQKYDPALAGRLREVIANRAGKQGVFLAVPHHLQSTAGVKFDIKTAWWDFIAHDHQEIYQKLDNRLIYLDTQLTRTYSEYCDLSITATVYRKLKQLWQGKRILIVEGAETRMGVGNDLFANAAAIKRLLVPSVGAFAYYDQIRSEVEAAVKTAGIDLVIAAIGPTATVLAYDLSDIIRTLDLGHLDIQYEYFRRHAKKMIAIPGKYTNEVNMTGDDVYQHDQTYESQIIGKVG